MKKTGRAIRLGMNNRSSKVVTLSKGTSALALTQYVCQQTTKKNRTSLDMTDVVIDVVNNFTSYRPEIINFWNAQPLKSSLT